MKSKITINIEFDVESDAYVLNQVADKITEAALAGIEDATTRGALSKVDEEPISTTFSGVTREIDAEGARPLIAQQLQNAIELGCCPYMILYPSPDGELCYIAYNTPVDFDGTNIEHQPITSWEDVSAAEVLAVQFADKHFGTDNAALCAHWLAEDPELVKQHEELSQTEWPLHEVVKSSHVSIVTNYTTGVQFTLSDAPF